jgi:hypothetical protein
VAFFALYFRVFSPQGKVGLRVVKLLLVKLGHARAAPFVVGVATAAGLGFESAMHARQGAHVGANVFVAVRAQTILGFAVELHMALLAVVFKFGVALNHFARGHDGLDTLRACCERGQAKQTRHNTMNKPGHAARHTQ